MYLITSRNRNGSEMIIWKYYSLDNAKSAYSELKKLKYKNVKLSKVIK